MMCSKAVAFSASPSRSSVSAGTSEWLISTTAAMCIAVGKLRDALLSGPALESHAGTHVSLLLWLMFTWSLGWTGFLEPSSPPRISMARFEMTYGINQLLHPRD